MIVDCFFKIIAMIGTTPETEQLLVDTKDKNRQATCNKN